MELDSAYFSVALPRDRDRERLYRQEAENRTYIDRLVRDDRVSILEGELHVQDGGRIEEKLVDVLCAVESIRQAKHIADAEVASTAQGVVVLSQDADLIPGIQLAQEFGVPVLSIAPGKVDRRGHPFLIIAEPSLADLVGAKAPMGQELRQSIATAATQPAIDSWEFMYTKDLGQRGVVAWMKHRHGLVGVCDRSLVTNDSMGTLLDLAPHGVLPGRGNEFPVLELGLAPHRSDDLVEGVVVGRYRLFQVTVDLEASGQAKVFVPNSYLTPGTQVLLQRVSDGRFRYIGALADPPPLVGCGGIDMEAVSLVATIREHRGQHALANVHDPELEVFIPSGASQTVVGDSHLISLVGSGRESSSPFVAHLASSPLPSLA
ncbi:MAG: NYN domain-containing protein [Acidobacteria bacterium]|nr:NYN domain-containing protein [Acidobacteriota bacterium]